MDKEAALLETFLNWLNEKKDIFLCRSMPIGGECYPIHEDTDRLIQEFIEQRSEGEH